MIKKILLIQFRSDISILPEQRCILKSIKKNKDDLRIINAFDQSIDFSMPEKILKGINRVILGGSGEFCFSHNDNEEKDKHFWQMIERIAPLVKYLLEKDTPTIGICFGHQLLAYNLGVKIINDKKQQETGSFVICLNKAGQSNLLFKGLPQKFIAQLGHKDRLEKLPKNTILLANSKKCSVESFQYKNNIYGVQFHPELTVKDIIFKLKLYPDYSSKEKIENTVKKLKPSPYAIKVMKNFINNPTK